ncbi:MAG: sigma-70 family RNA polymerase sigma factor [Sphingobacteriales bacterium]|nr:sigma-70 family RNA polymerase sigma factor [Sphingobacteriales bacterium]OJW04033.1 MAG: hypothetical protein BGO52_18010 [Sphingobacteriales bacterium 44-61]
MFKQIAAGSQRTLEEILGKYGNELRNMIIGIVHNQTWAEEVLFDTIRALWENKEKVAELEHPTGWLFTTARNKAIDKIREEKNHFPTLSLSSIVALEDNTSVEEELNVKELYKIIHAAIEKLPLQEKNVFTLFNEGWTRKEIAKKYNLSENTIKNHLALARKAIRKYVAVNFRSLFI